MCHCFRPPEELRLLLGNHNNLDWSSPKQIGCEQYCSILEEKLLDHNRNSLEVHFISAFFLVVLFFSQMQSELKAPAVL